MSVHIPLPENHVLSAVMDYPILSNELFRNVVRRFYLVCWTIVIPADDLFSHVEDCN